MQEMVHNRIKAFIQKEDGEKMTARLIDDAHWQILVTAARQLKQSARYQNASQKAPFDAAYAQLQDLEQNRDVTLKQFLKVQESLAHAVTKLDGQETTTFVLRQAISDAELLMETARYVNASPLVKEELNKALTAARKIIQTDEFVLQSQVDQTVEKLQHSATALSGIESDFSQLVLVFKNAQNDLTTLRYLNADAKHRQAFKASFDQAKQLLSQAAANHELNVTVADLSKLAPDFQSAAQETIDLTTSELLKARKALNGKSSDLTQLKKAVAKMTGVDQTKRYQAAYDSRQTAFDLAFKEAQTALADPQTTQMLADRLVSQLDVTYETLNGEEIEAFVPMSEGSTASPITGESEDSDAGLLQNSDDQNDTESETKPAQNSHDDAPHTQGKSGVVQTATLAKPDSTKKGKPATAALSSMLGFKRNSK